MPAVQPVQADPPPSGSLDAMPADLQVWLDQQERTIIARALQDTGFNRTAAAARLGLNLRQMRYRMSRLGIAAPASGCESDEPA
jgi:two-component system response regulator PilR (NtrC family)